MTKKLREGYELTVIGSPEEVRAKLEALPMTQVREEYEYRLRRRPSATWPKKQMIAEIVAHIDRTGDGPERLKDMLRF